MPYGRDRDREVVDRCWQRGNRRKAAAVNVLVARIDGEDFAFEARLDEFISTLVPRDWRCDAPTTATAFGSSSDDIDVTGSGFPLLMTHLRLQPRSKRRCTCERLSAHHSLSITCATRSLSSSRRS